jgi:hypothetical protein
MYEVYLVLRNQPAAELPLHVEQAVKNFLTRLDGERPWNVFPGQIERQSPIASDCTSTIWVVSNINQPVSEGDQRLIRVLA